jgi:1-acyl-sn-glycerol-3-phosphate acyltransferase
VAAARRDAREGLDWLGRPPEVRASIFVRLLALLARAVLFGILRFRIRVEGRELLPRRGGYIVMAAAHRGWMDPLVVLHALPLSPRAWFLGSGPSAFDRPWKEGLLRRTGGMLPVWRGGLGIDHHVTSARAVLERGGVFVQMPEGTVSGPPGRVGTFRVGAALIALRTEAPIVPIAVAGTEELYLGKRMAARVLAPTSARERIGADWPGGPGAPLPEAGSRAELELARTLSEHLQADLGPVVEGLQPWTVDPPGHPRRLRGWLTWLLLRRGPLDRSDGGSEPEGRDLAP